MELDGLLETVPEGVCMCEVREEIGVEGCSLCGGSREGSVGGMKCLGVSGCPECVHLGVCEGE